MMRMLSNRLASNFLSSYKFCSNAEPTLKLGDILQQRRIFTIEDVVEYSKVSHDTNPLHFDIDCAQAAGFQDRVVHGILVASLFPRIISSRFERIGTERRQPVYVGDKIVGEVQATNIRDFKKKILVKFSTRCLKKASGDLVINGEATAILPTLILQRKDEE